MAIVVGGVLSRRYRAVELLGRGGMGEVWRCFDFEQARDVAIKAVRAELLADSVAARLFHSEVIAVARLGHPGIIPVYDLVRHTDGTTLLVMEYRAGPSLAAFIRARPSWSFIRDVLIQVLEALAFAHARGVLHLDIKPENVVIEIEGVSPAPPPDVVIPARALGGSVPPPDFSPPKPALQSAASRSHVPLRATLVDFGIARIRSPGRGVERWLEGNAVVGTVEYMSPEQCAGTIERFGAWSDLYSVGAMAFELCAGKRPFPDAAPMQAVMMRVGIPAPELVPRGTDVPSAFIELCSSLLATDPRERPMSAADVLAALREMSVEAAASRPVADVSAAGSAPTAAIDRNLVDTLVAEAPAISEAAPLSRRARITLARDPSRAVQDERAFNDEIAAPAAGAYGLFGLRDLPVLGRPLERRTIWGAVRSAVVDRKPFVALLEGPAGAGKSRLARDVIERAVELGVCFPMQTSWSADGSGDEGLRGLLENLLDTRGAPLEQVQARLDFWLGRIPGVHDSFAREVALLLRPPPDAAPDAGLPLRVTIEAITRAAQLRPVLLWLDDVQWSRGEAALLTRELRKMEAALPLCVIATAREEDVTDPAEIEAILAEEPASGPRSRSIRVRVDPLDLDATRQLVRGLLDVDDELCEALATRAEGNPLFVTQLLRQLVSADAVERRDGHYRLARGFDWRAVPDDLGAVWERRVASSGAGGMSLRALALVRDRVSLEVARELGVRLGPDAIEWPPSSSPSEPRQAPVDFDQSLALAMSAGLLRIEGGAYVWAHGLLRDYLKGSLDPSLAPSLHAMSAHALGVLVGREDVQEERARHLRRAAMLREACEAILEAGTWSFRRADGAPRRARFETLALWAEDAGYADLRARGLAEIAYMEAELGLGESALKLLAKAAELAVVDEEAADPKDPVARPWFVAAAWVFFRKAQIARLLGRAEEGREATRRAERLAEKASLLEVRTLCRVQHGVDCARAGQGDRGRVFLLEAAELAREAGDRVSEAHALLTLAHIESGETALGVIWRSIQQARGAGALRVELIAKQVWVHLLWCAGARDDARREARALVVEASRRSLRQTVSILELQSAGWAASEEQWTLVREHRDAAERWGAGRGAVAERVNLIALDLLLSLQQGDEASAATLVDRLESTRGTYDDPGLRELLERAQAFASPAIAARLARPTAA